MNKLFAVLAALLALMAVPALAQTAPAPEKIVYVQAGRLLDKPGQPPRGPSTIVVRDGKVAEVRDGFVAPEGGATLVDLRESFVLPG
ncbi:MAG: hypothetical protein WDN24_05945 [Sphingomonas sp.]